ncbi:hypothetical protein AnigIFM63326_010318 [Aspergillus niger]|nr:hypothetical protein AnigIFM63326_010318 [Aspergillus niger]
MTESGSQYCQLAPGVPDVLKKRVSMACLACKRSKRKCSGTAPCDSCRAFNRHCTFDVTLDQRRRVAAKRTVKELSYYRNILNDLLGVLRVANQTRALEVLQFLRKNATTQEIRAYLDDALGRFENCSEVSDAAGGQLQQRRVVDIEGAGPSSRTQVMDIHYLCTELPHRVPVEP